MPFIHKRIIRFNDTDAAGVVYFANVLAMCHEAYEESLTTSGINLKSFFSSSSVAIPIVHAGGDFFRPMFCGDQVFINLTPKQLAIDKFEIAYKIVSLAEQVVAKAMTRHVCIEPMSRTRIGLPSEMIQWMHLWSEVREE